MERKRCVGQNGRCREEIDLLYGKVLYLPQWYRFVYNPLTFFCIILMFQEDDEDEDDDFLDDEDEDNEEGQDEGGAFSVMLIMFWS